MKHLNKKQSIKGAFGGAPKPKPAALTPPKLGGFKSVSSFSVAELIDLISDGPIEGLVDQNGEVLTDSIFKGIYLNNTPIQNTQQLNNPSSSINLGSLSIASNFNTVARIWMESSGNLKTNTQGLQRMLLLDFYLKNSFQQSRITHRNPDFPRPLNETNNVAALISSSKLPSAEVEIHIGSPVKNLTDSFYLRGAKPALSVFEDHVQSVSNNSGDSTAKSIANENLKKLKKIKERMEASTYPPNHTASSKAVSFFIFSFPTQRINELANQSVNKKINFLISGFSSRVATVFVQPEINNEQFTGNVRSLIILETPLEDLRIFEGPPNGRFEYRVPMTFLNALNRDDITLQAEEVIASSNAPDNSKELFNFSNISCQFKNGEEFQEPLSNFDKVFNDYMYESPLYGPYDREKAIQRILVDPNFSKGIEEISLSVPQNLVLRGLEGSVDIRSSVDARLDNFSNWDDENEKRDYDSLSVTHTIENPLVDQVSVTIAVSVLSDAVHVDTNVGGQVGKIQAGSKVPSIVSLRIETGKITNGEKTDIDIYSFSIVGLVEGACLIDLGSGEDQAENLLKDSVKMIEGEGFSSARLTRPFKIPDLISNEEPSSTKRYVKVVRLSAETNSVLINKTIGLAKVTEIIDQRFSYPFSATVGMKIDSRALGSIPERSFDCKLKRVQIPSNYNTQDTTSDLDIRYVGNAKEYVTPKQIYIGDWDGTFTFGWTDNPAWILYDLLISERYGLGSHIDESQVNKWELYKIARFCDAVDNEGHFVGVSNGFGGLEPRFSCNIMFKEQTKIYDAINVIANLFRGVVFFGGSEVHFLDDRPRTPIGLFSNSNVKEGVFNYSNIRRDLQFNTVEVVYLDRFDNYRTKVEYIQDEQDIRKRGVFKTTINTLGVTSRAMSRRIGQHIIHQTIKENQTVSFDAGLESLLCRPGDLIIVEDEMKTRSTNYGRILEVDVANKKLRIDNKFDDTQFTGFITVYSPTGYATSAGLDEIAQIDRTRVSEFSMTNPLGLSILSGLYKFSGYTSGYPFVEGEEPYPSQFPLYTGTGSAGQKLFCYYNTGATGFVFSTGLAFQNDNTFDKIITNTEVRFAADISASAIGNSGNYTGFAYNAAALNKRTLPGEQISGAINWDSTLYPPTRGILDSEIDTYNISQITKISLTGFDNAVDYGSFISLNQEDPNVVFLSAVKAGSIYRIERQLASDQIYKIISIRENSQNEYNVVASRYDTGKFETIEKSITQDFLENSSYTGEIRVGNVIVSQVATPIITVFSGLGQTSQSFKLTGRWISGGGNITGFNVSVSNSLAGVSQSIIVNTTGVQFAELTNIGNWKLSVIALASSLNTNSSAASTGTFVAYAGDSNITTITKPAIVGFSIE